jgi:NAD(P) transhydrogenase subunit alpha
MAAGSGGNVAPSKPDETVVTSNHVKVIGPTNLPSEMAADASALYAKNVQNLAELMIGEDGGLNLSFEDEIITGACITHDGAVRDAEARKPKPKPEAPGDKADPGREAEESA